MIAAFLEQKRVVCVVYHWLVIAIQLLPEVNVKIFAVLMAKYYVLYLAHIARVMPPVVSKIPATKFLDNLKKETK